MGQWTVSTFLIRRHLDTTDLKQVLKTHDAVLLLVNHLLSVTVDALVCVQLLLELDYCLVTLVQTSCESYHDISLFKQQLLVSVYLRFIFFNLLSFSFQLTKFSFILLSNNPLLLFQSAFELWGVFNFLTPNKQLRIQHLNLLLQFLFFFFLHHILS